MTIGKSRQVCYDHLMLLWETPTQIFTRTVQTSEYVASILHSILRSSVDVVQTV